MSTSDAGADPPTSDAAANAVKPAIKARRRPTRSRSGRRAGETLRSTRRRPWAPIGSGARVDPRSRLIRRQHDIQIVRPSVFGTAHPTARAARRGAVARARQSTGDRPGAAGCGRRPRRGASAGRTPSASWTGRNTATGGACGPSRDTTERRGSRASGVTLPGRRCLAPRRARRAAGRRPGGRCARAPRGARGRATRRR